MLLDANQLSQINPGMCLLIGGQVIDMVNITGFLIYSSHWKSEMSVDDIKEEIADIFSPVHQRVDVL